MTGNDNSVNIKDADIPRAAYHHGDLHQALVRAGVAALDAGGSSDDLSLRALARDVGVSATAVYRHFPDKAALLAALALAGFDRLAEQQRRAGQTGSDPLNGFAAKGAAYVRFALDHPALFRLMWATAPSGDLFDSPIENAHPAMAALRTDIAAILPADATDAARHAAALACWSLVHGLAMLALDGQIRLDDDIIARIVGGLTGVMQGGGYR